MSDSQIELAAETFKNAVELKARLIDELREKHQVDPRAFFEDEQILACEQRIQSLLVKAEGNDANQIAELTEGYQRLLDEAVIDFRRHVRTIKPPRQRSPMEVRRQRLNKLIKDIAAHKVACYEEFAARRDEIFKT